MKWILSLLVLAAIGVLAEYAALHPRPETTGANVGALAALPKAPSSVISDPAVAVATGETGMRIIAALHAADEPAHEPEPRAQPPSIPPSAPAEEEARTFAPPPIDEPMDIDQGYHPLDMQ